MNYIAGKDSQLRSEFWVVLSNSDHVEANGHMSVSALMAIWHTR